MNKTEKKKNKKVIRENLVLIIGLRKKTVLNLLLH